jgi:ABC-type multidrug transport system fused ATPase/permease subunit
MKSVLLKSVSLLFLSILLFSSCTVQKRTYNSGYHVNWHLNLASKNSKEAKVKVAMNKPLPSLVEENDVIQSISENYPLSTIDPIPSLKPKLKALPSQKSTESLASSGTISSNSSQVIFEINKSNKNLKLFDNITSSLAKHFPKKPNQSLTGNEEKKHLFGVWSFILALASWILFFIVLALAFGSSGGELLLLIFLIMSLLSAILSLVMGFSAISSPKNTVDLIFGILGILTIILPILLALFTAFI